MANRKKRLILWSASVTAVILLIVSGCGIYVSDYYRADTEAMAEFTYSENITKKELRDGVTAYLPENVEAGFIFYPGGKVEHTAYEPLMMKLAEKGIACVSVKMPFNLAVLDVNAADGIKEALPEAERWYIGGHSLGGSMAASYISGKTDAFEGLVLLGAYSTADLSDTELEVLSVYGSEDNVMNREKYEKYSPNLPEDFAEYVIDGGCHAYFGVYGAQAGDGTPKLSNEEQINLTADRIYDFICE